MTTDDDLDALAKALIPRLERIAAMHTGSVPKYQPPRVAADPNLRWKKEPVAKVDSGLLAEMEAAWARR